MVYLLLDIPVVLAHRRPDWTAWSRLGTCGLTESGLAELQYLTHRATEPAMEQAARAFMSAFPSLNWQVSAVQQAHPALQPKAGQALSKRARLVLMLSQCAYGLAQQHPNELIIVVSQAQSLITRLQRLKVQNLCAIPSPALRQWVRFGELPEAVTMAQTRLAQRGVISPLASAPSDSSASIPSLPIHPSRPAASQHPPVWTDAHRSSLTGARSRLSVSQPPAQRDRSFRSPYPSALTQVRHLVLASLALIFVAGLILKLVEPEKFEQLWQWLVNLSNVNAQ
jgi:hypothetical protein